MYVYHVDTTEMADSVVAVSDRIGNHTIIVPPNKPYLFKNDHIAQKFLEAKGPIHGIVIVDELHDEEHGRITLDIVKAKKEATEALDVAITIQIEQYVRTQQEDRLSRNLPAIPPMGRVLTLVKGQKIDLGERYGIHPIGWGKSKVVAEKEKRIEELEKENQEFRKLILALNKRVGEVEKAVS